MAQGVAVVIAVRVVRAVRVVYVVLVVLVVLIFIAVRAVRLVRAVCVNLIAAPPTKSPADASTQRRPIVASSISKSSSKDAARSLWNRNKMARNKPYGGTELAAFITHRIAELRPRKSQIEIASEAGYPNPNMLSMLKSGTTKLALDRVAALAKALETDPARLFRMALLQSGHETTRPVIEEVFGTVVTRNEVAWLEAIREASGNTDPTLTVRARGAILGIFGK